MKSDAYRSAFTLIEVLIVVVIMAVLAATIIPQFATSTKDAKESSLNFNLHTMRSQIELYKAHHNGDAPDDVGDAANGYLPQLTNRTNTSGAIGADENTHPYGPYFDEVPDNPFNADNSVLEVAAAPVGPGDGTTGWQYNPATGEIWPNNTEWTP
jgi:prepilin-type N-terminal cleavage/methylation domain-containing protein